MKTEAQVVYSCQLCNIEVAFCQWINTHDFSHLYLCSPFNVQTITSLEKQLAEVKGQLQESQFKSKLEMNELREKCAEEKQTLVKSHETSVWLQICLLSTHISTQVLTYYHLHTDCKTKSAAGVPEKFNCRET